MNEDLKNIVCIVQARMSSSRLPGKMMLDLSGKPVIGQVFHQLQFSKRLTKTVLSTSKEKEDDVLIAWAEKTLVPYFRGGLDNVLERIYRTAVEFKADIIVRVTGDCPLIDPEIIDSMIIEFSKNDLDYLTNNNPPTYPDGLDVELFTFKSFEKVFKLAYLQSDLEHVTPFFKSHKDIFKIANILNETDLQNHRWTLDNDEDYELVKRIYNRLYNENNFISYRKVLELIQSDKGLQNINSHIKRNEGYEISLAKEKKFNEKNNLK